MSAHAYVLTDMGNGQHANKCSACGASEAGTDAAHQYAWVSISASEHAQKCACDAVDAGTQGAHSWSDATCAAPSTCGLCKSTAGEKDPDAHSFTSRPSNQLATEATESVPTSYYIQCDFCSAVSDHLTVYSEDPANYKPENNDSADEPDSGEGSGPIHLSKGDMLNLDEFFAYMNGYEDDTIRPGDNISRAEFCTIIFRLLCEEIRQQYTNETSGFTDIKAGKWYFDAIVTLDGMGILDYCTEPAFDLNRKITRAEVAYICAWFAGDIYEQEEAMFADTEEHWAQSAINNCGAAGLIKGYEDKSFRTDGEITRAEVTVIINRMTGRNDSPLPEDMETWSDNSNTAKWYYKDIQIATNYLGFANGEK